MRPSRSALARSCFLAAFAAALAMFVAPAQAATISAPGNCLLKTNVSAALSSRDTTGVLSLVVDGVPVASRPVVPGGSYVFWGVPLKRGWHRLWGSLKDEAGVVATTTPAISVTSWGSPTTPQMISPQGGLAGRKVPIKVKVGGDTRIVRVFVNGTLKITKAVSPWTVTWVGTVWLPGTNNTIMVQARNPVGRASRKYAVKRVTGPWATGIVIDKSDFKLYLFTGDVLVKWYPVAIGKPGTPTPARVWRVGSKEYPPATSVYGPRKLRLYKRYGSPGHYYYSYSRYAIHGTNEPSSIGTMASHGCIRLYNSMILDLFPRVPLYTMVQTRE